MTIRHLSQSIAGLLRNNPVGTLDFVLDDKGNPLSDKEARIRLNKMLEQGSKYLPTNSECVGFDYVTGCPGHEPLVGSDLTIAMLKRGDKGIYCAVGGTSDGSSDESVLDDLTSGESCLAFIVEYNGEHFIDDNHNVHEYAIPMMVTPVKAEDVGL